MNDISKILAKYKVDVENHLRKNIPRRGEPMAFYNSIWELIERGGKRFRPALTLLSCEAVGGDLRKAIPVASAIELMHNMTLVHDDVEDGSELRLGKPCVHLIYGVPHAINAGDAMLIKVFEIASQGSLPDPIKLKLVQTIARRAYQVTWGQAYEFQIRESQTFTEEQVIRILKNKTGALVALSTEAGAIAGGANQQEFDALSSFGESIGVGFQIIDDILNVSGDISKYGKEIGGDIREGKRTIMAARLLMTASRREVAKFLKLLGKPLISRREIELVIEMYRRYGFIEYARRKAENYVARGVRSLHRLPPSSTRNSLEAIAKFLIVR